MGRQSKRRGTRRKKLRDAHQQYGPDTSTTVFAFGDHWSIRQPQTITDIRRIGYLLQNCLRFTAGTFGPVARSTQRYGPHGPLIAIRTLVDPTGYPRLVLNHIDGNSMDIRAYNERPASPEHIQRIQAWHDTMQLGTIDTVSDGMTFGLDQLLALTHQFAESCPPELAELFDDDDAPSPTTAPTTTW